MLTGREARAHAIRDAPHGAPTQAGTIFKLIERLTYEKYSDTIYLNQFLLTYSTFASSLQVRVRPTQGPCPDVLC